MKIKFRAKTIQTASHLPEPRQIVGIPIFITPKKVWYMEWFTEVICTRTNSFHEKGDIYLSKSAMPIDIKTLEISIDGNDFKPVEFDGYIIKQI